MDDIINLDTLIPNWDVFSAVPGQLIGVGVYLDTPDGQQYFETYGGTGRDLLRIWGYDEPMVTAIVPILNS